mgnify:CR=1 FL=1
MTERLPIYPLRFSSWQADLAALPDDIGLRVVENLHLDSISVKRLSTTHYLVRASSLGDYEILPLDKLIERLELLPLAAEYVPRVSSLATKQSVDDLLSDLGF